MNHTRQIFESQIRRCLLYLLPALILLAQNPVFAETAPPVPAVDPVSQSESFTAVLYNNTNGLPTSEANDIVQTGEGFIWVGSYCGLIRYDGNSFERMDSTNGLASIVRLYVDQKDRLWIGTNDNGVAMMERGELRQWSLKDGLGSDKIRTITGDDMGRIYVGTTAGITLFDEGLQPQPLTDPKIAQVYMEKMVPGSNGLFYCVTNEGDYFTLRGTDVVDYIDHNQTSIQGISSVLPDTDAPGQLYIGTSNSVIYHGDLTKGVNYMETVDVSPLYDIQDIVRFGNQIWICGVNGIGLIDGEGFHLVDNLPMNNSIRVQMVDYEGNIWCTSSRQGVMKLVPNPFLDIFARYGLPSSVVNSTCMYDDSLFIATDTGLIVLDENGQKERLQLQSAKTASGEDLGCTDLLELLDGSRIRSVIRDSRGKLWISAWRSVGLLCYDGASVTAFTPADGLLSDRIRTVCEAEDGTIIAAVTGGVNVIRDGQVTAGWGEEDGIANSEILTAAAAPNGDIILGSNGGGIYIIGTDGKVRCIDTMDGLSSGIIMRVKYDSKYHVYWLVTSNSISWMTEDYQVNTVQNFPYPNNFDLCENSRGDMWILSSDGIYVVPAEELLENGEIKPVHYGIANGLPCIATSNSYSELTETGDLYIAGSTGVAKVNIEASLENISDLKQAVPFIDVDDLRLYPDGTGSFRIPSKVQKLTIYGFVFNYSLTDPQVSYCLQGFDRETVTVNRSELGPVSYTNLPGGTYHFQLETKDALGRGSNALLITIVKEKAFYEQVWFYVLMGLAAALLIALLVKLYIGRRMRALEAKHREEAKRERIENELQLATNIQASALPHTFPAFPDRNEFDIYACMAPAKEVGGDFYDFFLIDDDHLGLVMADVSGKGVPAALFMMVSRALIRAHLQNGESPAKALENANEQLCEGNEAELFVTVWAAVLEISTGKGIAANAGHEHPALRRANGEYELQVYRHSPAVATMDGMHFREHSFQLNPGDTLFVYTDGVAEATNANDELFGNDRLIEALNVNPDAKPEEVLSNVMRGIDAFVAGAEQFDDITMLCLEYKGDGKE